MPDIPQEAVQAALAAYAREAYCDGEPIDGDERVIRCALEAAAPFLALPHAFTRDALADALTRIELRVMLTGSIAGMINAESMADAIIEALGYGNPAAGTGEDGNRD